MSETGRKDLQHTSKLADLTKDVDKKRELKKMELPDDSNVIKGNV